ncbi:MAG: RCC1 domain-containing protein, partial [bacterium]|nr:RCC1 domain-containing protein [bacterium]
MPSLFDLFGNRRPRGAIAALAVVGLLVLGGCTDQPGSHPTGQPAGPFPFTQRDSANQDNSGSSQPTSQPAEPFIQRDSANQDNSSGQADAPASAFTAITAGDFHFCGIRADNTAECWGANDDGQADAPAGTFTAITAGGYHSCGIRADNTAECWG